MTPILKVESLGRSFGESAVLQDIDLALNPGERVAVIGSSGSGKTTLLRLIAGLDIPSAGTLSISDRAVSKPCQLLVPPERRNVAMVFQGLALLPHLRALDQIAFAAPGKAGRERAAQLLDRIGLAHRATASLGELSGGERQRIALARALVQQPAILLMDEPFASLDDPRREAMRSLLRSLLDETKTSLILVTHARDDVFVLAERVMVLAAGRCVAEDRVEALLVDPRHAAAVHCLGLGSVLRGRSTDGLHVVGDFGLVTLSRMMPPGEISFLVRPHQFRLTECGPFAVRGIEVRPPDASAGITRIAVVECGSGVIRAVADRFVPRLGDAVGVVIDGDCVPLDQD